MEQTGLLRPEENARLPGSWGVGVWSQGRGLGNSLLKRLDETLNIVLSKDSTATKTSKTPDSKTNSSRLKFLEQTVKPGCHYAG